MGLAAFVFAACGAKDEGLSDASVLTDGSTSADAGSLVLDVAFESALPGLVLPRAGLTRGEGDELFSFRSGVVARSADRGRTWDERAEIAAFNFAYGDGKLYAGGSTSLFRSGDGAETFETLANPAETVGAGAWSVRVAAGALWVNWTGSPLRLFRSTDGGDSFAEVALPAGTTEARYPRTSGDALLALFNGTIAARTTDGASWETLGTYDRAVTAYETRAGTLLLGIQDEQGSAVMRSGDDGASWQRSPSVTFYDYDERPDGTLVRVGSSLVDESTDEGVTWTPRVASYPEFSVHEFVAFDEELVGVSVESLARLAHDAAQWTFDEEAGLPHPAVGRFRDIAFSETGRVALVGERRVFVSDDDGVIFRRGFDAHDSLEVGELTSIGIRPDGERIFVGSTNARFVLLEGDGETRVLGGTIAGRAGETIHQVRWVPSGREPGLYVTTGNDENTSGMVFQAQSREDTVRFNQINPLVVPSAPNSIRGAGYFGFDIARHDGTTIVAFVGILQWAATNYSAPHLYENLDFPNTSTWRSITRPVAFGQPLTISVSGEYGEPVAFLYPNDRLFVGSFASHVTEVRTTDLLGDLLSAKFAPDGKLWVVTTQGLYRSTTSLR